MELVVLQPGCFLSGVEVCVCSRGGVGGALELG